MGPVIFSARTRSLVVGSLLGSLLLTACSRGASGEASGVAIENCDREVAVGAPPERIVSLTQQTTELLLALGLEDRMVGTAWWNEPVRADLAEAEAEVPRLAERAPSFEAVLEAEPDFVVAGFDSMFTDEMVATRDRFEDLGIPTWLTPAYCNGEQTALDDPYELEDLYAEITDLATIFDIEERGEALVAELKQDMAEARAKVASLHLDDDFTAVFWYGTNDAPYMAGATGSPGVMTRTLGIGNAYGDNDAMWPQVNWEDVMNRDPDLFVMADLTREGEGQSMADKIEFITSDPAISRMSAVQEEAWVAMRGMELDPTINTVAGAVKLADYLVERFGDGS
jgi:iron complex transport system substrate-binding protein